ncbi:MAG: dTDP-4-dehydrorhamnose reductase [Thomasclavelia sp.]|jgi:dTDP-4-dehydrorhamnose reductase|nr:dTDP-4-dehydrorhamnose reductase [Thomasclavelia sp.]
MIKVWICGANGQIGKALNKEINNLAYEVLNTDIDEVDITDVEAVIKYGEINRPQVIINLAGMTDLEECEKDPTMAFKVNALGPRNLSILCETINAKIIHLSSDDVFDGASYEPYNEFDDTHPISVYGKTKLSGEEYVKEFTNKHFIIRSSWVYGEDNYFISEVIRRAKNKEDIKIAGNQYGTPTNAYDLARFIISLIDTREYGTYHATNQGSCSRVEFTKMILKHNNLNTKIIMVHDEEADLGNKRPTNTILNNFLLDCLGTFTFPSWKDSLEAFFRGNYND